MWGFLGCLVLIVAYVLLVMRGFEIAAGTREMRGRILALGVTTVFAAQVLINIGMVTGLLPIVGIPLPLMSYGGSSMVVSLTALGLLLSIRMRQFH
jgi:rod shape determining protein RodA